MDELELIKAELAVYKSAVAKVYNKTEEELDSIVKDETGVKEDGFENIMTIDAVRVKKLKGDSQIMFDKGYQKAEAEIKTKAEKTFKEKTGFNEDAESFEELIEKYVTEQGTKKKGALTDDDVKKHPAYLALEKDRIPKPEYEKLKTEYETYKGEVSRNEKMSVINSKVMQALSGLNIEKIENPAVESKRKQLFLNEFKQYDYEIDGDTVVIVKDGKRLEDEHGHLIPFNKLVESTASEHFVFLKQTPKGGAGNSNPDDNKKTAGTVTIKDEADYIAQMKELDDRQAKESDPAKVIEIKKQRIELGKTWMQK